MTRSEMRKLMLRLGYSEQFLDDDDKLSSEIEALIKASSDYLREQIRRLGAGKDISKLKKKEDELRQQMKDLREKREKIHIEAMFAINKAKKV